MILHFQGGKTAQCYVTKDGKKYTYFTAGIFGIKYRVEKATGIIQVAPHWKTLKELYIED